MHRILFLFPGSFSNNTELRCTLPAQKVLCSRCSSGKAIKDFFFMHAGVHPQPQEQNLKGAGEVGSAGKPK